MGAMIALDLVSTHADKFKSIVTFNAVFRRSSEAQEAVLKRAEALQLGVSKYMEAIPVQRWFGKNPTGNMQLAAEQCEHWLRMVDRQGYRAAYSLFAQHDGPSDETLGSLHLPALFVTGDQDLNSTPEMSQAMADIAPAAKSTVIENAGHMMQLTHYPEINVLLANFLSDGAREPK